MSTGTMPIPISTSIRSADDSALRSSIELVGRILLALLFLLSGIGKVGAYAAAAGYMTSVGVPGALLPLVILTEVLGAIAIIAGWRVRVVAALLAGFTLLSGLIFHSNFGDQIQMIMFLKNLSITGAFLMLVANGAGRYSLDARSARSK
jgi:putative oxidoreductase